MLQKVHPEVAAPSDIFQIKVPICLVSFRIAECENKAGSATRLKKFIQATWFWNDVSCELPQKVLDARAIDKGIHLMHVYIETRCFWLTSSRSF